MNSSIRAIIRACVAPKHILSAPGGIWRAGLAELRQRSAGYRESGAFLLGKAIGSRRQVLQFVYYDEIEPHCLDQGYVIFDGTGYGALWSLCHKTGLQVVADIHTHPRAAYQSSSDRDHPMIATRGHIAVIVPDFASPPVRPVNLGIYVYEGEHRWQAIEKKAAATFLYVGLWA